MYYIDEVKIKDIAGKPGIRQTTVKLRLFSARNIIRMTGCRRIVLQMQRRKREITSGVCIRRLEGQNVTDYMNCYDLGSIGVKFLD